MKLYLIPILVTAMLAVSARAELESNANSKSANKRTCRIIFPDRPKEAPKTAYLFDGKENHPVKLPSTNFSKVIELPEGAITLSISLTEITDPEIQLPKNPKLDIQEGVQDFYVLVSSDPAKPESLNLMLINISDEILQNGDTLWFNQTDHQIDATLGVKEIALSPGGKKVSESPIPASGYYRAEFRYQKQAKGDFYKITEQQWWHDENSKHLGFIVDSGGRLPKIYFYRDFR